MARRFGHVLLRLGFLRLALLTVLRLTVTRVLRAPLTVTCVTIPVRRRPSAATRLAVSLWATLALRGLRTALLLLARRTRRFRFGARRRLETFDGNLRNVALDQLLDILQ